jgi:RNA polymerase sigma factor (sigma-70 family)
MQIASESSVAREVPVTMNMRVPIEALDLEQAFLAGVPDALPRAYDRYGALVHTFASRGVGHDHASDVTQEVFIAAWRNRDRFDPARGALAGWLIGIARNKVLESLRRRRVRLIGDHDDEPVDATSPDMIDVLADRLLLADALGQLPERTRRLITLAFDGQLSHAEIAEQTGVPLGTVKSDIRRGLRRLKGVLEHNDG